MDWLEEPEEDDPYGEDYWREFWWEVNRDNKSQEDNEEQD